MSSGDKNQTEKTIFFAFKAWADEPHGPMPKVQILPLKHGDLPRLKAFTDKAIGDGYYSTAELEDIFRKSQTNDHVMTTLTLWVDDQLQGVRITYPPGQWSHGKGQGLNPQLWPHPLSHTAYFQSLFVAPELTGQSYGKQMSLAAIDILQGLKVRGIVCHSWVESPHDSSGKYLRGLGFKAVARHPLYWKNVDYVCTRCGKPCLCTAEEMYLDITDFSKGSR